MAEPSVAPPLAGPPTKKPSESSLVGPLKGGREKPAGEPPNGPFSGPLIRSPEGSLKLSPEGPLQGPPEGPLVKGPPSGVPYIGTPVCGLLVSPVRRVSLLRPYGPQRKLRDCLFLKIPKPKQTMAQHRGALEGPSHYTDDSRGPPRRTRELPALANAPATAASLTASPAATTAATGGRRTLLLEAAASAESSIISGGPTGGPSLFGGHPGLSTQRVNQLDALRVNSEVVLLLQDLLLQCTRATAPWLQQQQQELQLLLHLFLWAVSTARDRPTPGDLLQNIKYYGGEQLQQQQHQQQLQRLQQLYHDPAAAPAAVQQQQRVLLHLMVKQQQLLLQQQPLPWRHKLGLVLLHVLLPYLYQLLRQRLHKKRAAQQAAIEQRIRRFNIAQTMRRQRVQQQQQHIQHQQSEQQQQNQEQQENQQHRLQQEDKCAGCNAAAAACCGSCVSCLSPSERSLEFMYSCCLLVDFLLGLLRFMHFFHFLFKGRHRSIGDWLLGLKLKHIHPALRRSLSFELLQQQLYWQSVSHVLLLLLPHIDLLLLRRMLRQHLLQPACAAAGAVLLRLRLLLQRKQQQQQQQHSYTLMPSGLGLSGLLLLRSTKHRLVGALQEVGLLPHHLAAEQQQQQQRQQEEKAGEGEAMMPTSSKHAAEAAQSYAETVASEAAAEGAPFSQLSPLVRLAQQHHHGHHSQKWGGHQEQQKQQRCSFCKQEPLLPFRSSNCPHLFCYWCVSSHPDFNPNPWPLSAGEEQQLKCPTCHQTIKRIRWALAN